MMNWEDEIQNRQDARRRVFLNFGIKEVYVVFNELSV